MPDPEVISDTVNCENIKVGLLESMALPRNFLLKHFGKCIKLLLFMWLNCLSLRPFSLYIASQTSVNTILYVQFSVFKGQFPCLEYQIISLLSGFRYTLVDHLCFHNVLSCIALTFSEMTYKATKK